MQRATVAQLEELTILWKEVFKDDDSFLVPFLEARWNLSDVYYTELDGRIVSAIWYIRNQSLIDGKREDIRLIAGVATAAEYRKRGIMASLLEESRNNYTCPLVLYPAVRRYYEKHGFYSSSKALTFTLEDGLVKAENSYDIAELDEIYRESIKKRGGLLRDSYAWHSILEDHLLVKAEGAYALYSMEEKKFIEAAASSRKGAESLLEKLSGRVTAIPGSLMEEQLEKAGFKTEETLLGMCSDNIDIYIAEQY